MVVFLLEDTIRLMYHQDIHYMENTPALYQQVQNITYFFPLYMKDLNKHTNCYDLLQVVLNKHFLVVDHSKKLFLVEFDKSGKSVHYHMIPFSQQLNDSESHISIHYLSHTTRKTKNEQLTRYSIVCDLNFTISGVLTNKTATASVS